MEFNWSLFITKKIKSFTCFITKKLFTTFKGRSVVFFRRSFVWNIQFFLISFPYFSQFWPIIFFTEAFTIFQWRFIFRCFIFLCYFFSPRFSHILHVHKFSVFKLMNNIFHLHTLYIQFLTPLYMETCISGFCIDVDVLTWFVFRRRF